MDLSRAMDVERSSLCNCVVNFLLQENYLLTAFELLHELVEDGRDDQAIRLKEFFSDAALFPSDQISRLNTLRVADPQDLLEQKESLEKKLAISDYELRLAQEDILRLKSELQKKLESTNDVSNDGPENASSNIPADHQGKRERSSDLGLLKDAERRELNCAVKEYLLLAGYKLTAMTFYEEVSDQNLDVWPNTPACVPDALRRYYYQYLSCTDEAAEEKMSLLRERESLLKENERLTLEKETLQKNKDLSDGQLTALTRSMEGVQKELRDREKLVHNLKQTLELRRKEIDDCRSEITSLKMHIEGSRASRGWASVNAEETELLHGNNCKEEIKSLQREIESLKRKNAIANNPDGSMNAENQNEEEGRERHEDESAALHSAGSVPGISEVTSISCEKGGIPHDNIVSEHLSSSCNGHSTFEDNIFTPKQEEQPSSDDTLIVQKSANPESQAVSDKVGLETIQILSEALPKIVPYVLINHREELLPLMMCAIERHPDGSVRDSLTHTLFNLIKRPDEQQRRIIMDACVSLAKNVGEMRTETELLPQCWEQINHKYEERRLLVAQSCGELAEFVRPEIRDSLILSIVQQLVEDSAVVVREAAAHNLALLLPLFPSLDKYFKVEDLLFQLVCDPSGSVVETTLEELLHAVIEWGNKLDHILRVLRSHILGSAQRCPPLSGVQGSVESHLRVLGERERWNIEVFLRMLTELLPFVHQKAIDTCPFTSATTSTDLEKPEFFFSASILEMYARGHLEWPAFEWMHIDCFPDLIQLACLLPAKEDNLRNQIVKLLLDVSSSYGDEYLGHIMLPVFLVAAGDDSDLTFIPSASQLRIKGLRPKTAIAERLAIMCVLPLLLAGILGGPNRHEQLADYLRKLLLQKTTKEGSWSSHQNADLIHSVRFLCSHQEHHGIIFNILWEMVVSSNLDLKIFAADLLKILVPYVDDKVASTHVLPALVTLGSDQHLKVKYASIDAFGSVAQHFKNDMIVEKIRVQMDAFLEDGSHEATVAVVRSLTIAVPHTTERLRDYLLSKIFQLTTLPVHGSDVMRHREKMNALCEAIRALDATDLSATSVREFLLPSIQNLLKDMDVLDPAHKEALDIIMKERSGGTFEAISKVMGSHLSIASSMTSFFGEGGLLSKKDSIEMPEPVTPLQSTPPSQPEDTRFRRIIRGNFGDMFKRQTEEQ